MERAVAVEMARCGPRASDPQGDPRARARGRTAALALAIGLLTAAEAHASEEGLQLVPDLGLLLLLLALFAALVLPLDRLLFRPIFGVLDARAEKIAGTRQQADRTAARAEEVLRECERKVGEARAEAERERKALLDEARGQHTATASAARGEAEREIATARRQVADALQQARGSLRSEAELLARAAAESVLGRRLS